MTAERITTAAELNDFLTEISEFGSSDPAIIRAPHPSSASLRPYILTEDESGWWSATSFRYEDEDEHDVNALDIPLPWSVIHRPDRDLIAEAEARGARAVADHIGDSAASSDFMAGEVSDVGISWFMAEAREWAENVDGEHVHTYQGAQDPKTGDLHLVCMRCDEVRPARSEQTGGDRG